MARRLTEEKVTKLILIWLESIGWEIICYDFPQSGTGFVIHPNSELRETTKNKGSIIPDIVAVKSNIAVLFENKDRFVLSDFEKINELRTRNNYSEALNTLLKNHDIDAIFYGIGLPFQSNHLNKVSENRDLLDFIIFVDDDSKIKVGYDPKEIFKALG